VKIIELSQRAAWGCHAACNDGQRVQARLVTTFLSAAQQALRSEPSPDPLAAFLKATGPVEILKSLRTEDPLFIHAPAFSPCRKSLRSYRRRMSSLLALVPNLHPGAEGPERGQILDSATDGLSRRCKTTVFFARILCALRQEQFSRSVVVEGRHALALMKVTPYEVHSLWLPAHGAR
jgi:hypothetical protein